MHAPLVRSLRRPIGVFGALVLLACGGGMPGGKTTPPPEVSRAAAPAPPSEDAPSAGRDDEYAEGGPGQYTGPVPQPTRARWVEVSPAEPLVQVDGGYVRFCALTANGIIRCWGGIGADKAGPAGAAVDAAGVWAEVRVGMYQACGRTAAGLVRCWGTGGPNGEAPTEPGPVDGLPPLTTFDLSENGICGLAVDGGLHCVGNGRVVDDAPTGSFTSLSLGYSHACALRKDGTLACWGDGANPDGEPPFQAVPPPWPVSAVAVGLGYHTCALREDHTIGCWGGDGGGDGGSVYAGNLRAPPGAFGAIAAGYTHTCALTPEGTARCWGDLAAPATSLVFRTIASGDDGTCGILTSGNLVCWGSDQHGLLSRMPGVAVPGAAVSGAAMPTP